MMECYRVLIIGHRYFTLIATRCTEPHKIVRKKFNYNIEIKISEYFVLGNTKIFD